MSNFARERAAIQLPTLQAFIDNEPVDDPAGDRVAIFDPATGQQVGDLPDTSADVLDRAVQSAYRARLSWRRLNPRHRADKLMAIADMLEANAEAFATLETLDVGKPLEGARQEIASSADRWRYFAQASRCLGAPASGEYRDNITSIARRDPVGVVGVIVPWNYPMGLFAWKVAPALATGNTVIAKPSEETSLSTLLFAQLAADILPPGVLNIVTGQGETTGDALVRHPLVRMISLTGETSTGKAVMRAAADEMKKVHLELGGNAAVLVFDDADLDALAETIPMATFRNTGQDCHAASRIYVSKSRFDDVVDVATRVSRSMAWGDPFDPGVAMGPLVSAKQQSRVGGFVDEAVAGGATAVLGGGAPAGPGFFYEPTVLTGIGRGDRIVEQEVFGPVITVSAFESEDSMVEAANDSPYGLTASVWTNDIDRAMRLAKELEVQTVWINEHGKIVTEIPYGGTKHSGVGRELGLAVLEEYTELRHIGIGVRS